MRLLVYNIRYATGTGPAFHLPVPGAGYLRSNRKVLAGITDFIRAEHRLVLDLGSEPVLVDGDRFRARPRRDIPESEKPTPAMRKRRKAATS